MGKPVRIPISFGGGEISPSIYGRPDLKEQRTGQKDNDGMYISTLSSIINQPGTQYIEDAKDPTEKSRYIPFTFNREQSYMIELLDQGMRVIKDKELVLRDIVESGVYQWTLSGSGTSEYYLELSGGGDPSILEPSYVLENSSKMTAGTVGSLSAGEWDYGDNDTLGYSTPYVRLSDSTDPDTKSDGYVQIPYLLSLPYLLADIYDIDYTQSADTLFLTHSDYSPAKITRTADDSWTHTTFKENNGLIGAYKARVDGDENSTVEFTWVGTETRYGKTIGRWTVDASSGIFPTTLAVDDPVKFGFEIPGASDSLHWVNYFVYSQASSSQIVVYSFVVVPPYYQCVFNPNFAEGRANWDDLSNGTIAQNEVRYDISSGHIVMWDNNAGTQAIIEQPVAVLANRVYTVELITGTISGSGQLNLKVGKLSLGTYYVNETALATSDTTYTYDFRTEGELVYLSVDTTNATAGETQEIARLAIYLNDDNTETNEWRLPMWNDNDGYPSKCLFHNNRLWFFNAPLYPDTGWASKLGDYENFDFSTPIVETDSFSFTLATKEINEIKWAISHGEKGILIGTTGGEHIITGADGSSLISALSIKITQLSKYGSTDLRPLAVGTSIIFSPRSVAAIIEISFSLEAGGFLSSELSFFANHIFKNRRIVSWAYQEHPDSIIWAVLDNGVMVALSYHKEAGIRAFSTRTSPLGVGYVDVSVIPDSDDDKKDEVYIIVDRAATVATNNYYLEVFEPAQVPVSSAYGKSAAGSPYDYRYLESAVRLDNPLTITGITNANPGVVTATAHGFSNGDFVRIQNVLGMSEVNDVVYKVANKTANDFELNDEDDNNVNTSTYGTYISGGEARKMVTAISGLDHLEGQSVTALGDGEVYTATVSSGSITLGTAVSFATIGLLYTSQFTTAPLFVNVNSIGDINGISRVLIYFIESLYCEIAVNDGEWKIFELTDAGESAPLVPFTGVKEIHLDSDYGTEITLSVRNTKPLPLEISSIMVELEAND